MTFQDRTVPYLLIGLPVNRPIETLPVGEDITEGQKEDGLDPFHSPHPHPHPTTPLSTHPRLYGMAKGLWYMV